VRGVKLDGAFRRDQFKGKGRNDLRIRRHIRIHSWRRGGGKKGPPSANTNIEQVRHVASVGDAPLFRAMKGKFFLQNSIERHRVGHD
jgi:hypothetical protein